MRREPDSVTSLAQGTLGARAPGAPGAALPHAATAALLAASIAGGGCTANGAPPAAPQPTADVRKAPSSVLRSLTDPARSRVWSLTREGVFVHDVRTPEKIVKVALPSWSWVHAEYGCPPDLALGPGGEAVVVSNVVPMLWRIDPETLAVSVHELILDSDTNTTFTTRCGGSTLLRSQKVARPAPICEAALCMKPQAQLAHPGN
jgi:hypothetical protein